MNIFLWGLVAFVHAKPVLRCSNLPALHEAPNPLSKVYSPELYALRTVKWEDLKQAGLKENSTIEIGSDWFFWKGVDTIDFAIFVQPYLWPNAEVHDVGDRMVIETVKGRWEARLEDGGLRIAHISSKKESFSGFWGEPNNGCQVYMKSLNLPYLSAAPKEGVMLSFDHERSDVHIRVPREGEMPKNFGKKPLGKWIPMTSSDVPSVSLALGEEPISLMDSGLFRIPKEVSLPELQKLDKKIHIGNGSQMAVFGDEIALSIPLKGWFGCPLPRWQIKWGLRAGEKIAPHRRLIQQDGSSWYIEAQKGRMVIASTEERLNDVLEVGTTSWFSSGEEYEDNHFLARINIPTSMYMFVGPLEYVELTLAAQEEYWEIQFVPYTQSKAKPHQLFLTYFSTLQQWKKKEHTTVPKEVGRFLVHASIQRSIGNVFSIATQTEEEFLDLYFNHFWYEDERVFLEDEERNIWVYDPEEGVRLCVDDVTKGCESVK